MTAQTIFLYVIGAIISWVIFYYVVKVAVRNGIRESRTEKNIDSNYKDIKPEIKATPEQIKLQQRYDKSEITFEVYQKEWSKLT
ncbi:MAG TPA: hypothetical protein VIJ75_16075 [Hanamia sp.]